jgi:type II secretory pathway component PulF
MSLRWRYRALTVAGRTTTGEIAAPDRAEALAALKAQALTVLALTPAGARVDAPQRKYERKFAGLVGDLALLLEVGHTLDAALGVIAGSSRDADVRAFAGRLQAGVSQGGSLADALAQEGRWVRADAAAVVRVAEGSGALPKALSALADVARKRAEFEQNLSGALVYPAVLAVGALVAVTLVLSVAAPRLRSAFAEMSTSTGADPFALLDTAGQISIGLTAVVAAVMAASWALSRTPEGRRQRDRLALRVPGVGGFLRLSAGARVCRSLALAIGAGVRPEQALAAAAPAAGNLALSEALAAAARRMAGGEGFGVALRAADALPALATDSLAVAEQATAIGPTAARLADAFEAKTQQQAMMLARLAEPALIAVAGLVIGLAAYAMLSALTGLSEGLG